MGCLPFLTPPRHGIYSLIELGSEYPLCPLTPDPAVPSKTYLIDEKGALVQLHLAPHLLWV